MRKTPTRLSDGDDGTNASVGAVIIGRNEGERLLRCLDTIANSVARFVYVDSNSTDDSVRAARSRGAEIVELDEATPVTAARARNAGFDCLLEIHPDIEFVQFIDGDCELDASWTDTALSKIGLQPDIAAVCGRRRERFPERSIYNQLIDMEWDTPIGEAKYCGGDVLMRADAFRSVGGFNPTLIAGEEPDLCVRLRQRSYRILRLDDPMTLHDAAMTRFSQWWKRTVRAGYAFTQGASMHGASSERHWVRESLSIFFWGAALPSLTIVLSWPTRGWSLLLLAAYAVSLLRVAASRLRRGEPASSALLYATFCTLAKLPQFIGQLQFARNRVRGKAGALIEYK